MVQTLIESFNVEVIKVTIKDKPDLQKQLETEEFEEEEKEVVKKTFQALREYALRGRKIRELRKKLEEARLKRRLRRCFEAWQKYARKRASETDGKKVSKEKRIELFVKAIAEKQKELLFEGQKQPPDKSSRNKNLVGSKKSNGLVNREKSSSTDKTQTSKQSRGGKIVTSAVKNRLEAQKMIIQEQRARLAEQSRLILNMKFQEIDKEVKRTTQQTIGVAKQALNHCDQKTRRSLIHLIREQGCRDESITELPQFPTTPGFISRMEERAKARKEKIKQFEMIRQRKREEQKKKEELSRLEAEEEERKRQIKAMEEARRFRKHLEEKRQREIERNKKLNDLADRCYKKYLFRRYVKEPFGILVNRSRELNRKADQHYREILSKRIFTAWKNEWLYQESRKLDLACKFYRRNLLWYPFDDWRTVTFDIKLKYQVAKDFYDLKLQEKYIRTWFVSYKKIKISLAEKEVTAIEHYKKNVKSKYFNLWKKYMLIADNVRERELRRSEWRNLIKKFVPETPKMKSIPLYF